MEGFSKDRKEGEGRSGEKQYGWGSTVETEVNRGCRTLLWALANKWESADICTLSQKKRESKEGNNRGRRTVGERKEKGSEYMEYTPPWL